MDKKQQKSGVSTILRLGREEFTSDPKKGEEVIETDVSTILQLGRKEFRSDKGKEVAETYVSTILQLGKKEFRSNPNKQKVEITDVSTILQLGREEYRSNPDKGKKVAKTYVSTLGREEFKKDPDTGNGSSKLPQEAKAAYSKDDSRNYARGEEICVLNRAAFEVDSWNFSTEIQQTKEELDLNLRL